MIVVRPSLNKSWDNTEVHLYHSESSETATEWYEMMAVDLQW